MLVSLVWIIHGNRQCFKHGNLLQGLFTVIYLLSASALCYMFLMGRQAYWFISFLFARYHGNRQKNVKSLREHNELLYDNI